MSSDSYEYPFCLACQNTFIPVKTRGKNPRKDTRYVRLNPYQLGALIDLRTAMLLVGVKDRRTFRKRFLVVRDQLGRERIPKPELIAFFASLKSNKPEPESHFNSHDGNLGKKPMENNTKMTGVLYAQQAS